MPSVVVVDHDPNWVRQFEGLKAGLLPALSGLPVSIEHVGSTAVPGLAAKPIVDLDVVAPGEHVAAVIARLEGVGYAHRGDLGVPGREALRQPAGSGPRHNLYVCRAGSLSLANHLAVRDHLRANPEAVEAYGALKRRLAAQFPEDVDAYVRGKTGFLLRILRACGFDEAGLAEVADVNLGPPRDERP